MSSTHLILKSFNFDSSRPSKYAGSPSLNLFMSLKRTDWILSTQNPTSDWFDSNFIPMKLRKVRIWKFEWNYTGDFDPIYHQNSFKKLRWWIQIVLSALNLLRNCNSKYMHILLLAPSATPESSLTIRQYSKNQIFAIT